MTEIERLMDLDRRRTLVLARLGLMLSDMAAGNAPEVEGFPAHELYADVLMALGIEDADMPDVMLGVVRDFPDGTVLISDAEADGLREAARRAARIDRLAQIVSPSAWRAPDTRSKGHNRTHARKVARTILEHMEGQG